MRRLLWPALITLALFGVAVSLGVWQLERLQWKRAALADLDRAERSAPVPLPANPMPFEKVEVSGRLRDDLAIRYRAEIGVTAGGPTMGARLIEPLERRAAETVLIDRGWMPDNQPIPTSPDPATIVGYVRPPDSPGLFSPADDPTARRFYTLDPNAIGRALGLGRVAPFTIVALASDRPDRNRSGRESAGQKTLQPNRTDHSQADLVVGAPGGVPQPARALPRPANDHLGYALTWFGLAACMLAVFGAYARKVSRE